MRSEGGGRTRRVPVFLAVLITLLAVVAAALTVSTRSGEEPVGQRGDLPAPLGSTAAESPPRTSTENRIEPRGLAPLRSTSPWQDPQTRRAAERRTAVAALLDARAAAVLADDAEAWMATVDAADGAAVARERARITSLVALPVESWDYELGGPDLPVSAAPGVGAAALEVAWTVPVVLRYRLTGVDAAPVAREQSVTVGRSTSGWMVWDSAPRATSPERPVVQDLWDLGPVTVAESSRSVVVARGEDLDLAAYVAEAEAAAEAVDAVWGTGWPRRVAVLVPASQEEIGALVPGATPGLDRVAAVTTGRPESGGEPTSGDRVVVNPPAWQTLSPVGRQIVMTHETTHVATRAESPGDVPLWLSEGFADYVGYRSGQVPVTVAAADLLAEVSAGRIPAALPAEADFDASSPSVAPAYEGSWLACRLLVQRLGEPALVELYRATATDGWKAALEARTDLDHDAFVTLWRADLVALAQSPE